MKLHEIFQYLAGGELSQLHLGDGSEDDPVAEDKTRRVTQSIQLGLTALHSRFNIKNKRITVQLLNAKSEYPLNSKFLVSSTSNEPLKYIEDSPLYPFKDDILEVTAVFTEEGNDYPLNIRNDPYSAYYVNGHTLIIPKELVTNFIELPEKYKTGKLQVEYRANHPSIIPKMGPILPMMVDVELPSLYLQALLYFVASRHTNPSGMINEFHSGNTWYQKYEMECRQIENGGVGLTVDLTHDLFRKKGWV